MAGPLVLVCGGGELGTGAAHALHRAGLRLLILDRPLPRALRLGVCFAAAAVSGRITVAHAEAVHCREVDDIVRAWVRGWVPVWTGPPVSLRPALLIDARMRQLSEPETHRAQAPVVVGIGPGFWAGRDVDYVIESNRGPDLGRVITRGSATAHTGVPGDVMGYREERVLRAPCAGRFVRQCHPGDRVGPGTVVGWVAAEPVHARLEGMIRGLKLTGVEVGAGHKVGDVDPRDDPSLLVTMTDKAQAVGRAAVQIAIRAGYLPPFAAPPPP